MAKVTKYKHIPTSIKQKLRDKGNNICSVCGKKVEKAFVHHNDHNHFNQEESNISLVCKHCHPKIHPERPNITRYMSLPNSTMPDYLTPKKVAEELQIHINTLYRYIDEGKLKAVRMGGLLRIRETDLEDFISGNSGGVNK